MPETIRVKTPAVSSVPSTITGFGVSANFETVMFYFNPVNDIDLDSYAYQLYDNSAGTGTPVATGRNKANVFTISVTNSSDGVTKTYWGRVAVVNSAGTVGTYTNLVSSGDTPLIGNQYISSLTAAKITAGTIGAHEITLGGATSIIKSSTYNFAAPTTGWFIKGNGEASIGGPNGINFNGSTTAPAITLGSNVTILSGAAVPNSSGVSFSGLTITTAVGSVGGIQLGTDANNQWLTSGYFRTGNADKYLLFNPAGAGSLTVNGTVIQNGTVAGISASTNKLYIGVGNHANADTGFYVDSSGNFSLKDKLYWTAATNSLVIDGSVTIGSQTATAVSGAVTTASNAAAAAAAAQVTADGKINGAAVNANVTSISGGVITTGAIQSNNFNWNGTDTYSTAGTGIYLSNGQIVAKNFKIDGSGNASFAGTVTATSGAIGGWTLGSSSLSGSYDSGDFFPTTGTMTLSNSGTITSTYVRNNPITTYNTTVKINDYSVAGQGSITVEGTAGGTGNMKHLYSASGPFNISDSRLKNVIDSTIDGIGIINNVEVVRFTYKSDEENREHIGFIAQQVYEHIPESAFPGGEDEKEHPWMMSKESLIPYLTRSIQQLSEKVEQLESRLV